MISRPNNLELHLICHTCLLSNFTLVCLVRTDDLSGGRSVCGHVIAKYSRMGTLLHSLTHGAPLARFARESFAIIHSFKELVIYQYVLLRQQFHFQTIVGKLLKNV